MASKTPEIQADAVLHLVLDENSLRQQLTKVLGTTMKEAASAAKIGDQLASPKNMQALRTNLTNTLQATSKDLAQSAALVQSEALGKVLDQTRRDTVKKFQRDINDLMTGVGRKGTRSLPALPTLGADSLRELKTAMRTFGADALRSGSYQNRSGDLLRAQQQVAEVQKIVKELAGLPSIAAQDLQKLRKVTQSKDQAKYLSMQADERVRLAKSSQALALQTKNLDKLSSSLSKMGYGNLASEIRAANEGRRKLVSDFNRVTSPQNVDNRANAEARAQARIDRTLEAERQRALKREIKQREADRRAGGTYDTVVGSRTPGRVGPGLAASMDPATRARLGLGSREQDRATSLSSLNNKERARLDAYFRNSSNQAADPLTQIRQNIARAAASSEASRQARTATEQGRYNDAIRRQGDAQLAARETARKAEERRTEAASKAQQKYNDDIRRQGDRQIADREKYRIEQNRQADRQTRADAAAQEAQRRSQAAYGGRTASYQDAQRIIQAAGGIGNLRNELDLGIVRGGLSSAYRQSQGQLGTASSVYGQNSTQYRDALNNLNQIRSERDSLASRLRTVREEQRGSGGSGSGSRNPPSGGGAQSDGIGNLLGRFGSYAIGYGSLYQLLGLVTQLKTEIIELDRAFYSIKAVTQATDKEMRGISRSIRDVALNTNFTTREIASATELLGQAGVGPADLDRVLSSTARFASATNSSLTVAADLMTTIRTVYKELSENVIADQLTRAVNISKLTADDLKTILSLTSQTASSYNVNLEQLLGAVTTLRNAGVKPSTVATGLRQAMLEIFNPDTATLKALGKRYSEIGERGADGGQIGAQEISQRFYGFTNAKNPLIAALTELKRLGFGDEGQKTLQRGVDIRAFNAIQGLLSNFKELEAAENRITFGLAAAEGAEIQMQSLSASLENLGASVVVLVEQLSNGLVRGLADSAKEATALIETLGQLDTQLKAEGKDGIGSIFQGGLAGGAAGFIASKGLGFKGRAAATIGGAVTGGYLATPEEAKGEGFGGEDIAAVLGAVAFVGALVASFGKKLKPLVRAARATENSGAGKKALGALDALGGGEKTWGSRIGTVVSMLTFVGFAMTALDAVLDLLPGSDVEKLRSQAEAASANAARASKKLEDNRALVSHYDVNAENPEAGTTAAAFGKYSDLLTNFRLDIAEGLGEVAVDEAVKVQELLKEYANTPFSRRGNVREEIESVLGRQLEGDNIDKTLFDLGTQADALDGAVDGLVQGTKTAIIAVTERIREAKSNGKEVSEVDQALSQAFAERGEVLQDIIDGSSDLSSDEIQKELRDLFARYSEIIDERPLLEAQKRAALLTSLEAELNSALSAADNSAEISAAVIQIGNSVEYLGLSVQSRVNAIQNSLRSQMALVDQQLKEAEADKPTLLSRFASWYTTPLGEEDPDAIRKSGERNKLIADLTAKRSFLQEQEERNIRKGAEAEQERVSSNEKFRSEASTRAGGLAAAVQNKDVQFVINNPEALKAIGLDGGQRKLFLENVKGLTNEDPALLAKLGEGVEDKNGVLQPNKLYQDLDKITNLISSNFLRVSEAQKRRERDAANTVSAEELKSKTVAETDIKRAEYKKNFSLLASNSPDNPVVQQFAAERAILQKELAQAQATAADAKEDGSKTQVDKQQKVVETQAKLDTLDIELAGELEKYKAKLKTSGEQAQRKADVEAKKQASIKVAQTGIEQRITKQNFDEAIRKGDVEGFQRISDEYEAVQAKLRDQLTEELKARGYNTSQILDEIKLREDLNKPLAEQAENIRKLVNELQSQRDLTYRDIGSGPNLGSKEQTAYLGARGFTREEQAAAGIRDLTGLGQRRADVISNMASPAVQRDEKALQDLEKELDDLDTQIGETKRGIEDLVSTAPDAISEAFSPRNLIIELENSQYTFQNLGNNLRSNLVNVLDDAGDALARLVTEGGSFKDVLSEILYTAAQQGLADMFKTNLREGVSGLVGAATGESEGGFLGAIGRGASNLFGFGDDKGGSGQSGGFLSGIGSFFGLGGDNSTAKTADDTGSAFGALGSLFGLGDAGMGGGMTSTGTMNVTAGSVNIVGGGSGMPGGFGDGSGSFGTGGGAGGQAGGGGFSAGGALGGAGLGGAAGYGIGKAIGGKNGGKWGAVIGAVAGAYFGGGGFGMAGGGHITKSGMVMGSGRKGVDSVPVSIKGTGRNGLLAPGEGVLNTRAMDSLGTGWLNSANNGTLFRKAVGGVMDASYNASKRAQSSAANSVAMSRGTSQEAPIVNLKNVNITDKSQVFDAMQTREGEDLMINRLKKRGALKN